MQAAAAMNESSPWNNERELVVRTNGTAATTEELSETDVIYKLCGLSNDEQIEQWAQFCASVFAYKANPPPSSYFERHYINDPYVTRQRSLHESFLANDSQKSATLPSPASFIRVAKTTTTTTSTTTAAKEQDQDQIVASCRIFVRTISLGRTSSNNEKDNMLAGGIGEVCTDERHRKRGLSKALLQDAIEIMTKTPVPGNSVGPNISDPTPLPDAMDRMKVSLLHAAPAFFPVYQSAGYDNTSSEWTAVTLEQQSTTDLEQQRQQQQQKASTDTKRTNEKTHVRLAEFPQDTAQLQGLHREFSEARFAGCIVRSTEYWNQYLSRELDGKLWVWTLSDETQSEQETTIMGWLALRYRGSTVSENGETVQNWQLAEFGCNQRRCNPRDVMEALFPTAMMDQQADGNESAPIINRLTLPTFLYKDIEEQESLDASEASFWISHYTVRSMEPVNDDGWMYRSLARKSKSINGEGRDDKAFSMPKWCQEHNIPHLIWPSDSF